MVVYYNFCIRYFFNYRLMYFTMNTHPIFCWKCKYLYLRRQKINAYKYLFVRYAKLPHYIGKIFTLYDKNSNTII